MKIKDFVCGCGHNDFFFADKGNQKGIYCSYCGKWLKWAGKDEQNLAMKQEPILDKIRAEIKGKCFDASYKNQAFDYGLKIVKWSDVREIIDKYKAESEE